MQARDGVSLDAQEERCRALCAARGLTVVGVRSDAGASGRSEVAERPGLREAIALCREHEAVLVVYSVSRVARSQRILWTLLDPARGDSIALVSATEPFDTASPMGRAMLGMIGIWAQLEADLVSERTRDALAHVRAQGQRLGAPSMSMVNPEAVRTVHELRAQGLTLRAIVERLNTEGVPSVRGGKWWVKTVRAALRQIPGQPTTVSPDID
jgi:site-specific DNA recombinase